LGPGCTRRALRADCTLGTPGTLRALRTSLVPRDRGLLLVADVLGRLQTDETRVAVASVDHAVGEVVPLRVEVEVAVPDLTPAEW